jgi:hypothetical protein
VQIEEDDTLLRVKYATGRGEVDLEYPSASLDELLNEARTHRGEGGNGLGSGYEQTLRALGHELDRSHGRSVRLREHEGSFGASYISREGLRVNNTYLLPAILSLIEVGARRRRDAAASIS